MNFIEFVRTKLFVRHFLLSVVITAVIISLILSLLKWYTHHGESYKVPSLVGLSPEQIDQLTTIDNFDVIVIDSVFDAKQPKGTVLIQDPLPGSMVKKNRKIYLTTVAVLPEQIKMPNLVDLTLRQAKATIETYGLKVGNISYIPDIAVNAVLAQFYKGREIEPGKELLKGSVIDLRVGEGGGNGRYQVPFLIGKTKAEAEELLKRNNFVLGEETFEDGADPETAKVYSQSPGADQNEFLNAGQKVDLIYRDPEKFDFEKYLESLTPAESGEEQNDL
ncbi:MAG: PASTA domain-containing protein [Chloroflexota bacterium]|jgi:beta-lactam-binding protein with PASTA domain|nr:PASTA domain-containing protein [Lentimicrobium sp.]